MQPTLVEVSREGAVALVVMDNPATLNAMDDDMGPALVRALEELALDEQVRALVMTGAGGVFTAGGNLAKAHRFLAEHPDQGAGSVFAGYTSWVHRVVAALTRMPQPVVAAVEGAASGAGLSWILACDLVVAAQSARIVPGFVASGLVPAAGVNPGLGRLVGLQRASEILMLGRPLEPHQARELGLVDWVVPAGQAREAALALASELAQGPGQALAATKAGLRRAAGPDLMSQVEDERRQVMAAADLPEFRQRVNRFMQK